MPTLIVRSAIVDEQLPRRLARWVNSQPGWTSVHVLDLDLSQDIARTAEQSKSLIISKDEDFVTLRMPDRFPLLWLRLGNCHNDRLMARVADQWPSIESMLDRGVDLMELR